MKLNTNYSHSQQTSLDTTISSSSIYESESESESSSNSEVDDGPAQKKRKIDNPQARTVRDDLLAVDPILEGADC